MKFHVQHVWKALGVLSRNLLKGLSNGIGLTLIPYLCDFSWVPGAPLSHFEGVGVVFTYKFNGFQNFKLFFQIQGGNLKNHLTQILAFYRSFLKQG